MARIAVAVPLILIRIISGDSHTVIEIPLTEYVYFAAVARASSDVPADVLMVFAITAPVAVSDAEDISPPLITVEDVPAELLIVVFPVKSIADVCPLIRISADPVPPLAYAHITPPSPDICDDPYGSDPVSPQ